MPQGFAKKIDIELLLPDLLLQFPDPATGLGQCLFLRCSLIDGALQLQIPVNSCCRSSRPPAPTCLQITMKPQLITPLVKTLATDANLICQLTDGFTRLHALEKRGETVRDFPCLNLGVHSKSVRLPGLRPRGESLPQQCSS